MSVLPQTCVLRIWAADGRVAGTGFLVRGEDGCAYAVTCAHVINLALGETIAAISHPGSVTIEVERFGTGGRRVAARVEHWIAPVPVDDKRASPLADIAILSVDTPTDPAWPDLHVRPARAVVPDNVEVPFHGFGFMGPEDGTTTRGRLSAVDFGGWFVAKAEEGEGWFIEAGLSGAPIFGNNTILGMVVQRLGHGSRQGLIIPAMVLAQAWPLLTNPYVGLRSFTADTAHLFFGRGRPVDPDAPLTGTVKRLADRLGSQHIVAVVGASGSGKSSVVRAGLGYCLARRGWTVATFRPGDQPLQFLARALTEALEPDAQPNPARLDAEERWQERLRNQGLQPAVGLLRANRPRGILFVVDQFEEFFLAEPEAAQRMTAERNAVLDMLYRAAADEDVRVVLTLRMDFQERALADPLAQRMLTDPCPTFNLPTMAAAELGEAIEGAAALFNVSVDPGYLRDLAADASRGEGRLPLLQEALRESWRHIERRKDGWCLVRPAVSRGDASNEFAGLDLEAVLTRRADQALIALRAPFPGPPVAEADIRQALTSLVRLSSGSKIATKRILVGPGPDAPVTPLWRVVERLAQERLVVLGTRDGHPTAELTHDSLITTWKTLDRWITEDRGFLVWQDRFEQEFAYWEEHGRKDADLLRPTDVEIAVDWMQAPNPGRAPPGSGQSLFIEASRAALAARKDAEVAQFRALADAQSHQLAATRRGMAAMIALLVGMVAAIAGLMWSNYRNWVDTRPWGELVSLSRPERFPLASEAANVGRAVDDMKEIKHQVALSRRRISRIHLSLYRPDKVVDWRSLYGTTVNSKLLQYGTSWQLQPGDILVLSGLEVLMFQPITWRPWHYFQEPALAPLPEFQGWAALVLGDQRRVLPIADNEQFVTIGTDGVGLSREPTPDAVIKLRKRTLRGSVAAALVDLDVHPFERRYETPTDVPPYQAAVIQPGRPLCRTRTVTIMTLTVLQPATDLLETWVKEGDYDMRQIELPVGQEIIWFHVGKSMHGMGEILFGSHSDTFQIVPTGTSDVGEICSEN